MKSGSIAARALAGLLSLALLHTACGRDSKETPAPSAATNAEALQKLRIRDADNRVAVVFRWAPQQVQVLFDSTDGQGRRFLLTRVGKSRQRRYSERGVGPVALVRSNPDIHVFTLRTRDGDLLWRVRLGKNVILVEDNPTKPSFELRRVQGNLIRVLNGDGEELGRVELSFRHSRVLVRDAQGNVAYRGPTTQGAMLYGVLLAPDLDPANRYILMAELLHRQR